jgi:hypothetical protein
MEEEDLVCWICGIDLAAHTHAERIECEKQPIGDQVLVVHGNLLDLELRIIRRVLDTLSQLRPTDVK